ncbi:adenine deaminase [Frankia sp. Ag45/Mut15]|uniref:Adenine deaminase n=1 Tax=Frankia umida TaxID=573489 RepID=A0ABT0K4D1_9ACTN|nr:adenine deaminase C-terminal domain-containing protein [Frankia umida]MCK9878605.1 adenine deaminase [Frankia umida]
MNVVRTSRGPRLMSTPPHAPARTQTPAVMPGADREDPPARTGGPPIRSAPPSTVNVQRHVASPAQIARLRRVAAGEEEADLVVRGGLVMVVHDQSVPDQSVLERDILIVGRHIAAVTRPGALGGRRSLDAEGRYVLPAYVDAGLRIEDTLLSPGELARLLVPRGTGTLLIDPTALVAFGGPAGARFATESTTPLRVLARTGQAAPPTSGDPRTVTELAARGHLDHEVHHAVARGATPWEAIRQVTLRPARRHAVDHILGSLAPTRLADLQVVTNLASPAPPDVVVLGGRIAAEAGRPLFDNLDPAPTWALGRIRLPETLYAGSFPCPVPDPAGSAAVSIESGGSGSSSRPGLRIVRLAPTARGGRPVADPSRDLQKIAVIGGPPEAVTVDVGLVRGCGLVRGALGFTTAQAPGQLIVIGTSDDDLLTAARAVEGMGGGFVVVDQGWVRAACPLPVLGLMSEAPWEAVLGELAAVDAAAADLGCRLAQPLRTLAGFGCLLHTHP